MRVTAAAGIAPAWQLLILIPTITLCVLIVMFGMRYGTPPEIANKIKDQGAMLKDKHTWIMTVLYIATFGRCARASFLFCFFVPPRSCA